MVHGLVDQLWTRLLRDVLLLDVNDTGKVRPGSTPLPPLDLGRLFNNASETQDGWSFLNDPRNSFAVNRSQWLHGRILREARLHDRFIDIAASQEDPQGPVRWKPQAIHMYFRNVTNFKRDALVGVDVTGDEL
jgi:hypothetical protein